MPNFDGTGPQGQGAMTGRMQGLEQQNIPLEQLLMMLLQGGQGRRMQPQRQQPQMDRQQLMQLLSQLQ